MKKKTFLYSALLLGSLSLSSCTDMLDKEPLDKFTDSPLFWNNPSSVEGYAATFYNLFTGYGNSGGSGVMVMVVEAEISILPLSVTIK